LEQARSAETGGYLDWFGGLVVDCCLYECRSAVEWRRLKMGDD